jgi:hypothetical protein
MIDTLAAWLTDPHHAVIALGALIVIALFTYGFCEEFRRGGDR